MNEIGGMLAGKSKSFSGLSPEKKKGKQKGADHRRNEKRTKDRGRK